MSWTWDQKGQILIYVTEVIDCIQTGCLIVNYGGSNIIDILKYHEFLYSVEVFRNSFPTFIHRPVEEPQSGYEFAGMRTRP